MTKLYVVQSTWIYFMSGYKVIEGIFSDKDVAEREKETLDEQVSKNHLGHHKIRTEVHTITLDQPVDIDKYIKPLNGKI